MVCERKGGRKSLLVNKAILEYTNISQVQNAYSFLYFFPFQIHELCAHEPFYKKIAEII